MKHFQKNDDLCNVAELDHLEILNVYTFPPVRIHLTSNSLKEFGLFKSELTYFVDLKTPNLREANYNYLELNHLPFTFLTQI